MKVGMYNRWLATLGGGEKLSLSIAEYLSQQYPVTVISHKPVDKDLASNRLSLDLSNVEFEFIPERLAPEMTPITSDYDLFINASFLDFFPSLAPKSVYLVYFPTPVDYEPVMKSRRIMKSILRRLMMVPSFTSGVVSIEAGPLSQYRGVELPLKIDLPAMRRGYLLQFDIASQNDLENKLSILLNNQVIDQVKLPIDKSFLHYELAVPEKTVARYHELVIQSEKESDKPVTGKPDVALINFIIRHPRYRMYQLFFERIFKGWGLRLHNLPSGVFSILNSVDTYDAIWGISEFSRHWIWEYWHRPCEILTPPVNVEDFKPLAKKNQILSVGRFFAGSHNKKHLVMIKTYKEMVDEGLMDWELHLAGGTTPGLEHEQYLQRIYTESAGYPIKIHLDIPFGELVKLYGDSTIYWHASGFGEDEKKDPIKFEHFGITTVEAMASGCIPVVIGKGGQPEIVNHGENGYLWLTTNQLKSLTLKLIHDPELGQRMSERTQIESQLYDKVHFQENLHELIHKIGLE
jgi:glycosyltransferase involved in cell wall biosynthesis